ncbi:substrate-binding domain-containing protein [Labrenzia sp. OB1]|uniref:substrate-binding domain-containing protein n=1 Tax=Labrenzia sp. OB1 TaxID=1561204 RepID=UPI000837E786|nr:substrate-binding domain-containing protein [Labrenzia sp. OB1]
MRNITKRGFLALTTAAMTAMLPLGAVANDAPVIASIVFQGDQFMQFLQTGVRETAKAAGAEVLEINIDGDQAREIQAIDTYISRGVDAIVIAPLSAENSGPALKRARDAGITIIALNGGLADAGIAHATFSTANRDLGASTGGAAAAFIQENLGGKANVATLAFSSLLPEQSGDRTGGFKASVGEGNTINIVSEQDAWMPEAAVTVATDILTAHPEVNVIYAANEGGTVGAMQAVRNAGRAGEVFVFGIDGSEQLGKGLLAGDNVLQAVTAQAPIQMGAMGAEAALAVLAGEAVEAQTTVPALLLSRVDPDGVKAFLESIQ